MTIFFLTEKKKKYYKPIRDMYKHNVNTNLTKMN